MKLRLALVFLICCLLFTLAACTQGESSQGQQHSQNQADAGTDNVQATLVLDWVPNTNHTGIYVAQEKGYFAEQGLELTIIEPAMEGSVPVVAAGQAQFGISSQEALTISRSMDIPVVSIAAIIQENTAGFASPKAKNITSPLDFEGKTYGGFGQPLEEMLIKSVMEQRGGDPSTVSNIQVGTADFFVNTQREVDFQLIFYGWTGIEGELRGEELNMLYLRDLNPVFNYYTPLFISSEETIAQHPEVVQKFLAAVSKGYQFAIENPEEAAEILIKHSPETDPELIRASQKWLSPRYQGAAEKWGIQDRAIWENFAKWMAEEELVGKQIDASKAMTTQFLP